MQCHVNFYDGFLWILQVDLSREAASSDYYPVRCLAPLAALVQPA